MDKTVPKVLCVYAYWLQSYGKIKKNAQYFINKMLSYSKYFVDNA